MYLNENNRITAIFNFVSGNINDDCYEYLTDTIAEKFRATNNSTVEYNCQVLYPIAVILVVQYFCDFTSSEALYYLTKGSEEGINISCYLVNDSLLLFRFFNWLFFSVPKKEYRT